MRLVVISLLGAFALASCGGSKPSNKEIVVSDCLKKDDSVAFCECSEQALAEALDTPLYNKLATIIYEQEISAEEAMTKLDPATEQTQLSAAIPGMMTCALTHLPSDIAN